MKTIESEIGGYRSAPDMHTSLGAMASADESEIASFYTGKCIFITGATGFVGKVLVEKLLRSCDGIQKIYILLRSKKGVEPRNRVNELLNSKAFDRLRENNPSQLTKVIPIPGDITLPGLGISKLDLEMLIRDVSIVFHSAATVKFDEPLRTSINFNTLGTRYILDICHQMKKLTALVHVSTAYSNCDLHDVDEQLYPPPAPPKKIIELAEWMDDDTLNSLTPKLLGKRPNTYTYTKALAESLLVEESGKIPTAIVRPSIVTAAWREPYPGWVDNINGPTGIVLASGKGMLRTMLFDSRACADLIPVDMVINLMIAVAWHTATTRPKSVTIYNCTSGMMNGIKWGEIERLVFPLLLEYPSIQVFRYPGGTFKESRLVNNFCSVFNHLIPAYLFDGFMKLTGKKTMMVRIYDKLHRATNALEWFTTHDWNFKSNNVIEMSERLQGIDQKTFQFDVRNLQWTDYWHDYVLGIRKFILKEEDETIQSARNKLNRVYYTHKFISVLFLFGLWHMLLRTPLIRTVWDGFVSAGINMVNTFLMYGPWNSSSSGTNTSSLFDAATSASSSPFNASTIATTSSISSLSSSIVDAFASIAGFPTSSTSN